ncbi:sel1 repeat family protein [Photobacterium lipolyticum]|uniref:sel1 repeat family protein n=1 Tax=Photobacterium lipolyticum TaxID=266810 RepID=UPI0011B2734F|nr:sel1 repeat family protein [Photobacterium lipolyticum]
MKTPSIELSLAILINVAFSSYSHASFEQGMKYVQQARWDDAEQQFRAEAEAGNADAMYWLGRSLEFQDFQKGLTAGEWFYKSAELGNPWAMYSLQDNTNCDFFGWPCDRKDWKEIQIEIWRDMAAKGDGLAEYALASYDLGWKGYIPFVRKKKRIRRLTKALDMGYNYSAMTIYGIILGNYGYDTAPQYLRKESINYLLIAAKNGYAPAMTALSGYSDIIGHKETKKWLYKSLDLGYPDSPYLLSHYYNDGTDGFKQNSEQAYYYAKINVGLGGEDASRSYSAVQDGRIGGDLTIEKK